jgi:hypothetical protein
MLRAARRRENGNTVAGATSLGTEQVAPRVGVLTREFQTPTFGDRVLNDCLDVLVLVTFHPNSILAWRGEDAIMPH